MSNVKLINYADVHAQMYQVQSEQIRNNIHMVTHDFYLVLFRLLSKVSVWKLQLSAVSICFGSWSTSLGL